VVGVILGPLRAGSPSGTGGPQPVDAAARADSPLPRPSRPQEAAAARDACATR
jgi:hypothetical protein